MLTMLKFNLFLSHRVSKEEDIVQWNMRSAALITIATGDSFVFSWIFNNFKYSEGRGKREIFQEIPMTPPLLWKPQNPTNTQIFEFMEFVNKKFHTKYGMFETSHLQNRINSCGNGASTKSFHFGKAYGNTRKLNIQHRIKQLVCFN